MGGDLGSGEVHCEERRAWERGGGQQGRALPEVTATGQQCTRCQRSPAPAQGQPLDFNSGKRFGTLMRAVSLEGWQQKPDYSKLND